MVQTVSVPTRIGVENAVEVLEALRAATAVADATPVALDLAALQDFDSSALSLLLQLVREREAMNVGGREGAAAFLLNPPGKLRALADLYGVDEMLFGTSANMPNREGSA